KAADLFKRYSADKSVKREEAGDAFFRSALIYEKMKDADKTIKTFQEYVHTYGSDPKAKNLEAYFRIAQAYEQKHDKRQADELYKRIVSLGGGVAAASDQAEYPAHAAFLLAEEKLSTVEKSKISGGGKQLAASIQKFKNNVQEMVAEYNKVLT